MTDQDMEIWKAGFDLHDRHGDGPKTDAEWIALTEDCRRLYDRFGGTQFAFHMAMMIIDYYSDTYRNGRSVHMQQMKMAGCD